MRTSRFSHRVSRLGVGLVLAVSLLAGVAPSASAAPNDPVNIPDSELRTCINNELEQPAGHAVTVAQALTFTEFACWNPVVSLTGLEAFTNLTYLGLMYTQVSNLSPLQSLTNLTDLHVEHSQVSNVSPLQSLTNLTRLYLGHNQISNVSPLQSLTNLYWLDLRYNLVSSVSGLNTLTNLDWLDLTGNQVSNVSGLNGLTNLTQLELGDNGIVSVSGLNTLPKLTYLDLSENQIVNVSGLSSLTKLTYLNLSENQIVNVSGLSALTKLETLYLGHNQISNVSPLAALTDLDELFLHYNQISDVSPLEALTKLTWLQLDNNHISDASPLGGLLEQEPVNPWDDPLLLYITGQTVALSGHVVGVAYPLPVTALNGTHPSLTITGGAYSINASAQTITYSAPGTYTILWYASHFNGTMTVEVVADSGLITIASVAVTGTAAVGQVVSATVGTVYPSGATLSYQWLRAGQPIAGATKSTYTVTTKDMCLQLSVRVTASKSGYPNASVTSLPKAGPVFTDVPSSHTFHNAICWVAQKGVTVGTGAGMFSPSDPVNRGSMAAFLYRMAGSPAWTPPATSPFTDVPKTHKFYKEITWLAATGITVGVTIGGLPYYQPDNVVNRGSMSAFMYRLSGSPSYTAPVTPPFADVGTAHTFYKTIAWLASKNITAGTTVNGQFVYQPSNAVNRGSMAAFLNRLANQHLQCATYPNGIQCGTG